jgi:hypothetical protein
VAAVGIVVAATAVAGASVPSLPHRTAAQLLADVAQGTSTPLGPFTATVQETADLGLPQLPQAVQPSGSAGLTSGTQSITIWYRDAQHIRVAEPVQAGESDLRLDGRTLWLWSSKTQTATQYDLPAHLTGPSGQSGNGAAPMPSPSSGSGANPSSITPAAAASQVLKAVGPSTVVAVQSNVKVAGRPAYQLALVPRSSQSLVGQVLIAIDASRHIPLRVEVLGRGSAGLVYSVGFTSLSFGTPAASNFSFTPPPGATVKTQVVPSSFQSALTKAGLSSGGVTGLTIGGTAVSSTALGISAAKSGKLLAAPPIPKQALATINAQFAKSLPASMSKAQRAAAIQKFDQQFTIAAGGTASATVNNGFVSVPAAAQAGKPKVLGTDWLSVVATPPSPQVAASLQGLLSGSGPASPGPVTGAPGAPGAPGQSLAALRALLIATTQVHGNWGSGRLLQTKLLSVLITSKGQILAGAVTPTVLFADVAADAG